MSSREISRSQQKRDAEYVEQVAHSAVSLPPTQLKGLPVDDEIRWEIEEAQRTSQHGARKRQIKRVAKLLRATDITPVAEYIERIQGERSENTLAFHRLERLRDWIVRDETGEEALEEAERLYPSIDKRTLLELADHYRRTGNKRYMRELFRILQAAHERQTRRRGEPSPPEGEIT